jgi:hypothetical protein
VRAGRVDAETDTGSAGTVAEAGGAAETRAATVGEEGTVDRAVAGADLMLALGRLLAEDVPELRVRE